MSYWILELIVKRKNFQIAGALLGMFCLQQAYLPNANAISETQDYESQFTNTVKPFYERGLQGSFTSPVDGIQIRYRKFVSKDPTSIKSEDSPILVILPAQGIAVQAYAETIFDLQTNMNYPLTIYAIDHRGQGDSDRILQNSQAQYVEHFRDYIDDLHFFLTSIVQKEAPGRRILFLAESMGGAIGSLLNQNYPDIVSAMILLSPMFGIQNVQFWQVNFLSPFHSCIKQSYAFGQEDYKAKKANETEITQSHLRQETCNQIYSQNPQLITGGVSFGWVIEAYHAASEIESTYTIQIPTLLLQAEKDRVVDNVAQLKVCARSPQFCRIEIIPNSKHLILREKDEMRDQALQKIRDFIQSQSIERRNTIESISLF